MKKKTIAVPLKAYVYPSFVLVTASTVLGQSGGLGYGFGAADVASGSGLFTPAKEG